MNELDLFENTDSELRQVVGGDGWYTIEELAELSGFEIATLQKGDSPLLKLRIDFEVETRFGGYHNTKKFYSEKVLKALKEYQLKNSVPNAVKDKKTVISGNISYVETETVGKTIDYLLDNPDTIKLLLQKSLEKNKTLAVENKQLKEIVQGQKPMVDGYQAFLASHNSFTMQRASAMLKDSNGKSPYGRNNLIKRLKIEDIFLDNGMPKREYIDRGYFEVRASVHNGVSYNSVMAFPKGMDYIAKKLGLIVEYEAA